MVRCVPIDQDGPVECFECGADLFEIGEFAYMVHRDVWLAEDFPNDVPINFDSRDSRSERLRARLAAAPM